MPDDSLLDAALRKIYRNVEKMIDDALKERLGAVLVGGRVTGSTIGGSIPLAALPAHNLQSTKHPDVSTTAPTDGDLLRYNATTSKWEPYALAVSGEILVDDDAVMLTDDGGDVLYE